MSDDIALNGGPILDLSPAQLANLAEILSRFLPSPTVDEVAVAIGEALPPRRHGWLQAVRTANTEDYGPGEARERARLAIESPVLGFKPVHLNWYNIATLEAGHARACLQQLEGLVTPNPHLAASLRDSAIRSLRLAAEHIERSAWAGA